LPRSSLAESLLIVAISGRALAASARRAGFIPLVADFFADADTIEMAHACRKLGGDIKHGLKWEYLAPALDALLAEAPSPPLGLVYGSGFEDRPQLLERIAARGPVLGNDAETLRRVKEPRIFFSALQQLGVPHPRTTTEAPQDRGGWLSKRQGGAGGSHIRRAGTSRLGDYFQEIVTGRAVSVLFVGNGKAARVLGFSEQWTAPRAGAPWRYGGAVSPATLSPELQSQITHAVERVAAHFKLKGLGSADFMASDRSAFLLEINPRPGATLEIFDSDAAPLLHLHVPAVLNGILPMAPLPPREATAAAIVYALAPIEMAPGMVWPDWTSDQPKPGERIEKDRPICTVLARAPTGPDARRLVEARRDMILRACVGHKGGNQ
jgi:predicted ATP-grasp superfamily ATP-dependent carboligase